MYEAVANPQAAPPDVEVEALVGSFSAFWVFNLRSPTLLSILLDAPNAPPVIVLQSNVEGNGKQAAWATAAVEIDRINKLNPATTTSTVHNVNNPM